jgi:uncharacterized protein
LQKMEKKNPSIVNSFSGDGFTALHLAAFFGHKDAVRFLIEKGADVNAVAKNMMKVMPLHSAVAHNQVEISEMLVQRGADVNATQEGGITPLHESAQNGNVEITELLIENGAKVNARTTDGRTPFALTGTEGREAGPKEKRAKVAEILREHGGKE